MGGTYSTHEEKCETSVTFELKELKGRGNLGDLSADGIIRYL
jgi:hypothetical protein